MFVLRVLTLFLVLPVISAGIVRSEQIANDTFHYDVVPKKDVRDGWFQSLPILPILLASSDHIENQKCKNQSRQFLTELDNLTLWAVEMFDSSTKIPDGILAGQTYHLGHYDECIGISAGDIQGQYCIVNITIKPANYSKHKYADPYVLDFEPIDHVWEKMKYTGDKTKVRRDVLYLALCVPAICKPQDIQKTLSHELRDVNIFREIDIGVNISSQMCTVRQNFDTSSGVIAYSIVIGTLVCCVLTGTYLDFFKEEHKISTREDNECSIITQILLCFSVKHNLRGLLSVSREHPVLDAMNGIKVIFMLLIIMGHRLVSYVGHPLYNADVQEGLYRLFSGAVIANGELLVDVFLLSSATLLSYQMLGHMEKNGKINLIVVFINRFIRLTPPYMLVLFSFVALLPQMGSGPYWNAVIGLEKERCTSNWWTNLLYVNNYVGVDKMCMFQSWYLSCDFQLYIICSLVIFFIYKWPHIGYTMLALLFSLSVIVPVIIVYWTKADALLMPYGELVHDIQSSWYYQAIYIKTHNRASPYLLGVILGLMLHKLKSTVFKLRKFTSYAILVTLPVVLGVSSFFVSYVFCYPGWIHSPFESAMYFSLGRVGFSGAFFIAFILGTVGNLDILVKIFSWRPFVILCRLIYGAFLIHTLAILYDQGTLRVARHWSIYRVMWYTLGDYVFSFGLSMILNLILESPMRRVMKLLLRS